MKTLLLDEAARVPLSVFLQPSERPLGAFKAKPAEVWHGALSEFQELEGRTEHGRARMGCWVRYWTEWCEGEGFGGRDVLEEWVFVEGCGCFGRFRVANSGDTVTREMVLCVRPWVWAQIVSLFR